MRRSSREVGLGVYMVDGSIHSIVGPEVSSWGPFERNICLLPSFIPSIIFLDTFAASPSESETGPRIVSFWPQVLCPFGMSPHLKLFPDFRVAHCTHWPFCLQSFAFFQTTTTYYPFTIFDNDGVFACSMRRV
jgi:hypothetical protein